MSQTHTLTSASGAVAAMQVVQRVAPGLETDGLATTRTKTPRAHEVERSEKTKARSPGRGYPIPRWGCGHGAGVPRSPLTELS